MHAPVSGAPHSKFHLHPEFPVKHIQAKGKGKHPQALGGKYTHPQALGGKYTHPQALGGRRQLNTSWKKRSSTNRG